MNNTLQEINKMEEESKKKRLVSVRINAPESGLAAEDLKKITTQGIDAVVIPKVETEHQVTRLSNTIKILEKENNIPDNSVKLIPSIESSLGVVNAYSIAKSD